MPPNIEELRKEIARLRLALTEMQDVVAQQPDRISTIAERVAIKSYLEIRERILDIAQKALGEKRQ